MSGDYYGLSGSHLLYLDSNKVHALRFGFQASYMVGKYDVTKPGFNPLMDPKSFYYYNPKSVGDLDLFSNKYMNFALGLDYSLTKNNVKFETSIGAYNITNPKTQLPWIDSEDPGAKWIGARSGDVIEIQRFSESAGNSTYHRYCTGNVLQT
jgi:DNA-directed RNA polymerase subunit H (RpoH/RPB5)